MSALRARQGADILYSALKTDPLWSQLLNARGETIGPLAARALFAHYLRFDAHAGSLCFASGGGGIAAWQHLRADQPSRLWTFIDGWLQYAAFGDLRPRVLSLFRQLEAERDAVGQHQYLEFLGVRPELQGRGIGSELLDRGPSERRPSAVRYLETFKAANVRFYQSHGFQIVRQFPTEFGCDCWTMARPGTS